MDPYMSDFGTENMMVRGTPAGYYQGSPYYNGFNGYGGPGNAYAQGYNAGKVEGCCDCLATLCAAWCCLQLCCCCCQLATGGRF